MKGKRVGTPEWQLTANVWTRALLEEDYGVKPSDIRWVRGGLEEPGRKEKVAIALPPGVVVEDIGPEQTLNAMLQAGEIDAFIGPRAPTSFVPSNTSLGWVFEDPTKEAMDYYRRTRIFPMMHIVGVRRSIADAHPWLPMALLKAFERSKRIALENLADTSATKVTLPFVDEQLRRAHALHGRGLLAVRAAGQPSRARVLRQAPPRAGRLRPPGRGRRAVSSGHRRELQDLKRSRTFHRKQDKHRMASRCRRSR